MLNYNVKIGLAPMRRNVTARPSGAPFAWDAAEERGERFVTYIENNFRTMAETLYNKANGLYVNNLGGYYIKHLAGIGLILDDPDIIR